MQNIWLQAFQRSHKKLGAPACRQGDARVVMLTQVSCTSICRNASSPHITAKLKMIIPHHSHHILHHSASFCVSAAALQFKLVPDSGERPLRSQPCCAALNSSKAPRMIFSKIKLTAPHSSNTSAMCSGIASDITDMITCKTASIKQQVPAQWQTKSRGQTSKL